MLKDDFVRTQLQPLLASSGEKIIAKRWGDLLFYIPVQSIPVDTPDIEYPSYPVDLTGNNTILRVGLHRETHERRFQIKRNLDLDFINSQLGALFWAEGQDNGEKWLYSTEIGSNYLGLNLLFQCTRNGYKDLLLFSTPRTSSTNPSIEQVAAYLQLTPADVMQFNGQDFIFNGQKMTL